jgi:hypothetical protein
MEDHPAICSLCWIDRVRSPAIKGWLGIPICREHMAETVARASGHPVIMVSPGIAAPATLQ